jgi:uncharacterized protein involved in exopolysaccharide biosynthesis
MSEQAVGPSLRSGVEEVRLMDLATIFVGRWRIIVGTVAAFLILGLAIRILVPDSYRVSTVLVPVEESGGMRSQLGLAALPAGLLGLTNTGSGHQAQIAAILKSASLNDSIVNRLTPEFTYANAEDEIRHVLNRRTSIRSGDGKSIIVEIRGSKPELITRIAHHFPAVINSIVVQLGSQAAVRKHEFLEDQLAAARVKLEGSEQDFLEFQQLRDAPEIQEQARRTMEAAAQLQVQIMEQEIRVAQLGRTATRDNPELRAATAELGAWRAQLRRLTDNDARERQVFLTLKDSPELQLAATRLLREYKKDEQVYVSLLGAIAETQVDASNTLPVVSVLDHAEMPKGPVAFPILLVVGLALFLGLMVGMVGAVAAEYAYRARSNPENGAFFAAWDQLKLDVSGAFRRAKPRPGLITRG